MTVLAFMRKYPSEGQNPHYWFLSSLDSGLVLSEEHLPADVDAYPGGNVQRDLGWAPAASLPFRFSTFAPCSGS